jgi:hypothetical protein
MTYTVFIHTNAKQMVGAQVAAHSLKRNSSRPDAFDVRILRREDYPFFEAYEGRRSCGRERGASGPTTTCSPSRRCASRRPNSWATRAAPW